MIWSNYHLYCLSDDWSHLNSSYIHYINCDRNSKIKNQFSFLTASFPQAISPRNPRRKIAWTIRQSSSGKEWNSNTRRNSSMWKEGMQHFRTIFVKKSYFDAYSKNSAELSFSSTHWASANSSYLDLAMISLSLNKIKCLSWVCKPTVSCTRSSRTKVESELLKIPLGSPLSEWEEESVVSLEKEKKKPIKNHTTLSAAFLAGFCDWTGDYLETNC